MMYFLVVYLLGVFISFVLLVQDHKFVFWKPKLKYYVFSVFRNCFRFYLLSWYAVVLIALNRKIKKYR